MSCRVDRDIGIVTWKRRHSTNRDTENSGNKHWRERVQPHSRGLSSFSSSCDGAYRRMPKGSHLLSICLRAMILHLANGCNVLTRGYRKSIDGNQTSCDPKRCGVIGTDVGHARGGCGNARRHESSFGGSEPRHGVNLRRPKWATRQEGNNASSVTGPANANYLLTGGRIRTTSKPQN